MPYTSNNLQSGALFLGRSRRKEGKSTPDTSIWQVACQKSRIWTFIWLVIKQKKKTSQILIGYLAWGVISGRGDCCGRAVGVMWKATKFTGLYCFTSLLRRGLFRLSGRLGNRERGNKARGSWGEGKWRLVGDTGKGKEKGRDLPIVPREPPFSLSFAHFLAFSSPKEPLRRRELFHRTEWERLFVFGKLRKLRTHKIEIFHAIFSCSSSHSNLFHTFHIYFERDRQGMLFILARVKQFEHKEFERICVCISTERIVVILVSLES